MSECPNVRHLNIPFRALTDSRLGAYLENLKDTEVEALSDLHGVGVNTLSDIVETVVDYQLIASNLASEYVEALNEVVLRHTGLNLDLWFIDYIGETLSGPGRITAMIEIPNLQWILDDLSEDLRSAYCGDQLQKMGINILSDLFHTWMTYAIGERYTQTMVDIMIRRYTVEHVFFRTMDYDQLGQLIKPQHQEDRSDDGNTTPPAPTMETESLRL